MVAMLTGLALTCFLGFTSRIGQARLAILLDDFKVGDQVEVSVSGLEGDRYYEPCIVTGVLNTGYEVKCGTTIFVVQRAWVRRPTVAAGPTKVQPAPKNEPVELPEPRPAGDDPVQKDLAAEEKCNFTEVAKITDRQPFSAAVAKRKLYDNYNLGVRLGGTTSPLEIGVTFLTLELGRSFKNVAPDGFRVNDAAPLNATIYTLKSEHIVCERYRNGSFRRRVESKYACFINKDGQWACGLDGVPKIVQLQ